jgi:hypothetical protein
MSSAWLACEFAQQGEGVGGSAMASPRSSRAFSSSSSNSPKRIRTGVGLESECATREVLQGTRTDYRSNEPLFKLSPKTALKLNFSSVETRPLETPGCGCYCLASPIIISLGRP